MVFKLTARASPPVSGNRIALWRTAKACAIALLIFCCTTAAHAIQATVMHKIFYAPTADNQLSPYLEAYWQVDPATIAYRQEDEKWVGKIRTDIVISSDSGVVREEHFVLETTPLADKAATLRQNIIDLQRFPLKEGKYTLVIKFSDLNKQGNEYTYTDSVHVAATKREVHLSDIQLVDTSVVSGAQNIFQRNGVIQIPLAANFLGDNRNNIQYYAEVYNLETVPKERTPLFTRVYISKKPLERMANDVIRHDSLKVSKVGLIAGKLAVTSLSSGNYYLNVVVEDRDRSQMVAKSLFFQMINTDPVIADKPKDTSSGSSVYLDLNRTFVAKYTAAQIRAILKMLLPIADPNEANRINSFISVPDEMYSRYFVYNFWLSRNKLRPEEEWKEYSNKVREVNKLFGSSMLPGYETERGLIYLKYGKPTERITVDHEQGALPYEVWQYTSLPGNPNAIFLFYRPGFVSNDYRLLHSTVNGEVRNRGWRTSLYTGGASSESRNSRAEQFIGNR